ncbi:unnamed protein product [Adineta steineri]|uniref:Uncharacterized protein n=1 Tax=Adineta steineri TaxID=433720 RepID=A0A814PEG7_9BILA|nr:unnamed protein product [Adineta steineri]
MKNDGLRRLPPPPLFAIRPPPKPSGSLFENFQTVEILNGRCVRPSLKILSYSSSPTILQKYEESPINWLNIFLLILAVISVICCIIIAISIFICLKKLRKEEKQYQNYIMSASVSSKSHHYRRHCTRTSEHYKCTSHTCSCCDDYYSHQLMPMGNICTQNVMKLSETQQISSTEMITNGHDTPVNHQYECIPEYLLTMNHRHQSPIGCHHSQQLYQQTSIPYSNFSRSYLTPQPVTTTTATTSTSDNSQCTCSPLPPRLPSLKLPQEESSTPLLASSVRKESRNTKELSSRKSLIIGWTRRHPSSSTKQKSTDQRYSFLSQLRKSSIL